MEVDAVMWYWSANGMRRQPQNGSEVRFVEAGEAERLLEEAHERGRREGYDQATSDFRFRAPT